MKGTAFIGLIAAVAGLSGCGGGGSGGGGGFSSFTALSPDSSYRLNGRALAVEYTTDGISGDVSSEPLQGADARVNFTLDGLGDLSAATLSLEYDGPQGGLPSTVGFRTADGDVFSDGSAINLLTQDYVAAVSAGADRMALVGDPIAMGFQYQTFGIWATGIDTGNGSAGAVSFGRLTPTSSQPLSGEANYVGKAAGFYLSPEGVPYAAFADFEADFNFGTKAITTWTSDTHVINTNTGVPSEMTSLDFTGTGFVAVSGPFGTIADGTFSSDISTSNEGPTANMAGTLDGSLYGPFGNEIGGVFALEGELGQYVGAIGAAR